ncbi:MAG: SDR family NAD(P)-dependent oxidoreductase [Bacteroidetes bacterium]|nr:SDR family NAD(P)-dependent oxidoreductase [Bacteroidota bacterium]
MEKNIIVTGASGMLGNATAQLLARRKANLFLVVHRKERGEEVLKSVQAEYPQGNHKLYFCDLSDLEAVSGLAVNIAKDAKEIYGLIHTAAMLSKQRRENSNGFELMFATNVISRFVLNRNLLPLLQAGQGRIISVTGPSPDRLNFTDLMAKGKFQPFLQFRMTNAANLMLSSVLARHLQDKRVTSNAYHPGVLQSNLMKQMPMIVRLITFPFGKTADQAANALTKLALDNQFFNQTGLFFKFTKVMGSPKNAQNVSDQEQLWETLQQLTKNISYQGKG